ncbi:MAG: hypothetical protein ACJ75B_02380 [Flavisolibacter sp.]
MIMILSFLFYVFVFYLGYKLLFEFILPLVRTTRQVRRGFRDMNQRMRQHTEGFQNRSETKQKPAESSKSTGDYIDFEEVK